MISSTDFLQIVEHIANEDGIPIFSGLWTCMTSRYIRAQALTLIKSHEERIGPLMGAKRYGLGEPVVAYSDDPVKVPIICPTPLQLIEI